MFNDKQEKLFNKGYGAYRNIIKLVMDHADLLGQDKDESAPAIVMLADMEIQKMLLDTKYAKKYHADNLPDKKFINLLQGCFNAKPKDKMSAIDKLYKYVIKSGGGFDIGQFRGWRKIEKR